MPTSDSNHKGNVQTAWEDIGDDINISAKEDQGDYERKQHKLWFDRERSNNISKEAGQLQWLHDPKQYNADNLNNVTRGTRRHFMNKTWENLNRTSVVKGETGDMLVDHHSLIFMDPCIVDDSVEIPTRCSFVIEFIIPKFIEGSACFERHTAHHQEL